VRNEKGHEVLRLSGAAAKWVIASWSTWQEIMWLCSTEVALVMKKLTFLNPSKPFKLHSSLLGDSSSAIMCPPIWVTSSQGYALQKWGPDSFHDLSTTRYSRDNKEMHFVASEMGEDSVTGNP
jgi:hypothetical protein